MEGKDVGALIGLVLGLPTLIALFIWSAHMASNPGDPSQAAEGAEILAKSAVPWWVGVFQWLAGLPGIIGAILIIGFVLFLKWIGEVR